MTTVNTIILVGHLGRDPELKRASDKGSIVELALATSHKTREESETTWHNVTLFGQPADAAMRLAKKGDLVSVQGRQRHKRYEKDGQTRIYSDVVANTFTQLTPKNQRQEPARSQVEEDSDVPF